ncbi:MAG: 4Fe-4S dicluster domain-containing protein [Vicinamibacteria bacterium]|nr:4Fe-4S dicluster domain-containing protein [Vicinamibacteria bacterium]
MANILAARIKQGHRTLPFPPDQSVISDRYRGLPRLSPDRCVAGCRACAEACPTGAIRVGDAPAIDMGLCLFCGECAAACERQAIVFSQDYRMAACSRSDLVVDREDRRAATSSAPVKWRLFRRSLKLRQVSAGGCNACEADINVLGTLAWDLGRFGVQFVASPRHADGLLVTGPVSRNMELALRKTYDAVPEPRIVIAVGACAISGGPYMGHEEARGGVGAVLPVDLHIPGCPPHPLTILDGLLRVMGKSDPQTASPFR